ncbi:MAG: hypothetical protein V4582_02740 [Pseudomonadota bacterium]
MIVAAFAMVTMQNTQAHSTDGLWYGVAMSMCLVQDAQYAALPMGQAWSKEESVVRWINELTPQLRSCIVKVKPVPAALCKELLSPQPNERPDNEAIGKIYKKYAKAIDGMGNKLACK